MKKVFIIAALILSTPAVSFAATAEKGSILLYRDCIETNNVPGIKQIVEHGNLSKPINGRHFEGGRTPLILAVQLNQPDVVRYLLENGADVTITDDAGKDALMYAPKKGKITKWLINKDEHRQAKLREKAAMQAKMEAEAKAQVEEEEKARMSAQKKAEAKAARKAKAQAKREAKAQARLEAKAKAQADREAKMKAKKEAGK